MTDQQVSSRMKPNYTSLNKLTDKSEDFRLKVRVTQKGPVTVSPSGKKHQRLLLKDDEVCISYPVVPVFVESTTVAYNFTLMLPVLI